MPKPTPIFSRRNFLKFVGASGIGSMMVSGADQIQAEERKTPKVPMRPFGKTGVQVPILAFGGSHNLNDKTLLLKQAFNMGVTYWDTAPSYAGGNSEAAMGKYFERFPEDRKSIFLVTKSDSSEPEEIESSLYTSLERLRTDAVDLFLLHGVSDVETEVNLKSVKVWSEKVKAKGKIRFFGFSAHKNMARCLADAAKLGWIDGIMCSYNYRLMQMDEMNRAVDACVNAGIGLTAMKTQAPFFANFWAELGSDSDAAEKLTEQFVKKGFSTEQAKLKAVWDNPKISSICSEMTNMTILMANVAAAKDKAKLSAREKTLFENYAQETVAGYCMGCARRCEPTLSGRVPISDIMRCLMYDQGYGDMEKARATFQQIPAAVRSKLLRFDYTMAQRQCPQRLPLARLIADAARRFA